MANSSTLGGSSGDANLFGQSYEQIVSKALGGNARNFQLLAQPQSFNWAIAPTGQLDPQAYQIMSGVPLWSPLGTFSAADSSFFSTYREVLNHVTFKVSPERQQDLKDLQNRVTQAGNDVSKATSDANQAYLTQKQNGGVVFAAQFADITTWLSGPGVAFEAAVKNASANQQRAIDLLLELQKAGMPSTLQDAIDAAKMPTGDPASSTNPRGWTKVPDGSGILQWQPDYTIGTSGGDWRAELSKGSIGAFSLTVNASDSTSALDKSWAGASGSTSGFFSLLTGSGSGSWSKMDLATADKSVTATISVQASTIVPVTPGAWYDGGFMRDLARASNDDSDGFTLVSPWGPKGGPGSKSLFGQFGLLSARVAGLVVAYKPSFSVTMSNATFEQHHEKYEASFGLSIGPFSFGGGSGGHETDFTHKTSGGTTFTGGSTSDDPVIIGMLVAFPGLDQA